MISWKLAVLLLGVVVAVSALDDVPNHHLRARRNEKEEVVGPSPDHEKVKPFEFLGNGDNLHRRVARRGGPVGSFGPRPEPGNAKPFEALGSRNEHQSHDARAVHSGDKNFAIGHRVARALDPRDFLGLKERFVRHADLSSKQAGPSPDHEQVKPFEFLGNGDNLHRRVARRGGPVGSFGPRPEPVDVKPFEFLGKKGNIPIRVARDTDNPGEPVPVTEAPA
ncbi:hypothetical protein M3Y99_00425400 [Aphelenchoides fujianensis]|nr:hypothetical protein M3Y99_00425400 [Aphelenchoides fujianensis]